MPGRRLPLTLATLLIALTTSACATRAAPAEPRGTGDASASRPMLRASIQANHPHDTSRLHAHDEGRAPDGHAHARHAHADAPPLRAWLRRGWCLPPPHTHRSACGTPYVHGFLTEPAFLGRDAFVDVTRHDGETEIEAELEWALTRRLGLIVELPYVDAEETGFGDAALGLRALLLEYPRFLLSASGEVELPTGSERRGLGRGTYALGGRLHTWLDLGSWVTLQAQAGVEHVPEEDESEFVWSATLAKSFCAPPLLRWRACGGHEHGPTTLDLIAEVEGATALDADGNTEGRWLLGVAAPLTGRLDLRGGFSRTFGGEEDESAWTIGAIWHF